MRRRDLLSMAGSAAALATFAPSRLLAQDAAAGLKPMTGDLQPIGRAEYLARIERARALMGKHGIGALLIEPGASMVYFTGVHWWRSERLTAAILPREGDIAIVTPHFEEPSVRESLEVPAEVRVWNENEDPLGTVAGGAVVGGAVVSTGATVSTGDESVGASPFEESSPHATNNSAASAGSAIEGRCRRIMLIGRRPRHWGSRL